MKSERDRERVKLGVKYRQKEEKRESEVVRDKNGDRKKKDRKKNGRVKVRETEKLLRKPKK